MPRIKITHFSRTQWLVISLAIFNIALACILLFSYKKTILSFKVSPVFVVEASVRQAEPVKIEVGDINLQQTITPAEIAEGTWQVSDTTASFLNSSARPGESGNIVIYGHNTKDIFAKLHQIKEGQVVTLHTNNGLIHQYKVSKIATVTPDSIEYVLPTSKETLTIYTCTGFLDSLRLVVQAEPVTI